MLHDLWRFRDLLLLLVRREIRVRYARTILGVLWSLVLPVAMMLFFTLLNFSRLVPASSDFAAVPYPVFAYCGLLPWAHFSTTLTQGAASLANARDLLRKSAFPLEVIPLSRLLALLLDLAVGSAFLVLLLLWHGIPFGAALLCLPLVLLLQVAFTAGVLLVLSASNVFFRDVAFLVQVGVMLAMFVTSVLYPAPSMVSHPWLATLLDWNPMSSFIDAYREAVLLGRWPSLALPSAPGPTLLPGLLAAVLSLLGGGWFFRRLSPRIAEEV